MVVFLIILVWENNFKFKKIDWQFFLGSTYQNAQKMYALYQQFDKNGDGKITADDIQIYLQEMGLGAVSPC